MRVRLLTLVVVVAAVASVLTGSAVASGPAAPGKQVIDLNCAGIGPVTVSVQRGQNSKGAGQLVDMKGHGIPVTVIFTVTDTTKSTVIDSETQLSGGGNGHPNQATIECTGVIFQGSASDFFGPQLPPGVASTDQISASVDAFVILKL